jgi:hypothetical protein
MDEATLILLSRHLDGDLTAAESQALAARLQEDGELRDRLDGLKVTRLAVQNRAESEIAPAELDRLVDPLVRGRPPAVAARPWVRWLATAAAAILGLTVILEFDRQRPASPPGDRYRSSEAVPGATPTARFSLAPLPTSPLPAEEQPVGASDRLIASPIPEMELDSSPLLEVAGPLSQPFHANGSTRPEPEIMSVAGDTTATEVSKGEKRAVPGEGLDELQPGSRSRDEYDTAPETTSRRPFEQGTGRQLLADRGPEIGAKLFVFLGDRTEWRLFEPVTRCKSGRYAVRVRVESGRVVEVWPLGAATSPTPQERLCAAELAMGLALEAVPDGEHRAEVLVEREHSGR